MTALFKLKSSCLFILPLVFMTQTSMGVGLSCLASQNFSMGGSAGINFKMEGVTAHSLGQLQSPKADLKAGDIFILQGTVPISVSATWDNMSASCVESNTSNTTSICTITGVYNPSMQDTVAQISASQDGAIAACIAPTISAPINYQIPSLNGVTGTLPTMTLSQINAQGQSVVVDTLSNQPWGQNKTDSISISPLVNSNFTVSAAALTNQCSGITYGCSLSISPTTFTLIGSSQDPSQTIQVNLSQNAELVLNSSLSEGSAPNVLPSYQLIDKNNQTIDQGTLTWNTPLDLNIDPSGAPWTLKTPGIYQSSPGSSQYIPSTGLSQTISFLNAGSSKEINLIYSVSTCPTENLNIQVTGLPSGQSANLIASSFGNSETPISQNIQNGANNLAICQDLQNWRFNPEPIPQPFLLANHNNYFGTVLPPVNITADKASDTVNITYSDKPLTSGLLVGYLQNWGTQISISQAAQMGYNVVVLAFACLEDTNNSSGCIPGQVGFYNNTYPGYPTAADMVQDIQKAKQSDGLKYVLASFGGATIADVYPIDPPPSPNPQINLTFAWAHQVVSFLNLYGLDGIDLDDEKSLTSDGPAMKSFLQALKQLKLSNGATPIVSSAPQFNSTGPSDLELVSTGTNTAYNDALKAGLFDYVFVQGYNTPGNYINDCDELMPCFITQGGAYLGTPSNPSVIPLTTSIIMGNPASSAPSAAGSSVFQNAKIANPYQALANEYSLAVLNPRLGGAMTWSITEDADAQCQFSKAMAPVITGADPSTLQCP